MRLNQIYQELKRRNVIRVAIAYAVTGWLIIQVVTAIEEPLSLPGWFDTVSIVLVGVGFPIALIIAWAFELTPEGLQKTREVPDKESITPQTGKKLNRITIITLAAALIFLLTERVFFAESTLNQRSNKPLSASIAVLPFADMSEDGTQEYFSDGLSEEILNVLAGVEQLQVAGRTSSFKFKGQNVDLREVGNELGVEHILEGSVRKAGNRLRITAQLIRADNGFHMWSETYDREYSAENIFDIQEDISRKVFSELSIRLLPEADQRLADRMPTTDVEAYSVYLEALQLQVTRRPVDLNAADQKYRKAIKIDPTFAEAYARLSFLYVLMFDYAGIDRDEADFQIRKFADQALMIDKNQAFAYAALGVHSMIFDNDIRKAIEQSQIAFELSPNDPLIINNLGVIYNRVDSVDQAIKYLSMAYELDPLNPTFAGNMANIYEETGEYEKALEIYDKVIKRNPNYILGITRKAGTLARYPFGKLDEAYTLIFDEYMRDPKNIAILRSLISLSSELDMLPLMEFYIEELEKYFPNIGIVISRADYGLQTQDYDYVLQYANEIIDEVGRPAEIGSLPVRMMALYGKGELEEAILLAEEIYPELRQVEAELPEDFIYGAARYSKLLKRTGQTDRAEIILQKALPVIREDIDAVLVSRTETDKLWTQASFYLYTEDMKQYIPLMRELYFDRNKKTDMPIYFMREQFTLDMYKDNEELQQLKEDIYEDLHLMRDKVTVYMQTKNFWQEEWD